MYSMEFIPAKDGQGLGVQFRGLRDDGVWAFLALVQELGISHIQGNFGVASRQELGPGARGPLMSRSGGRGAINTIQGAADGRDAVQWGTFSRALVAHSRGMIIRMRDKMLTIPNPSLPKSKRRAADWPGAFVAVPKSSGKPSLFMQTKSGKLRHLFWLRKQVTLPQQNVFVFNQGFWDEFNAALDKLLTAPEAIT